MRNNSIMYSSFELRGKTSSHLKLYAHKQVEIGFWWVMTGMLSFCQVDTIPSSVMARQLNDNVWLFPIELCDLTTNQVVLDKAISVCESELLFHADYVDYANRAEAHLILESSGSVVCIRTIRAGQTDIKLYSNVADNEGKQNRAQLQHLNSFVLFLVEQVGFQLAAMPDPNISAIINRDKILLEVLSSAIGDCTVKSYLELINYVDDWDLMSKNISERHVAHEQHILCSAPLWLNLIAQFLFPYTGVRFRELHKLTCFGEFIDVSDCEFTLIEFYTLFKSVSDKFNKYMIDNSAHAKLYMRDKLAVRVNDFMSKMRYLIPSIPQMNQCPGASNFGSDYEYMMPLRYADSNSSAYLVSGISFCFIVALT
jgi:hypothetical protein